MQRKKTKQNITKLDQFSIITHYECIFRAVSSQDITEQSLTVKSTVRALTRMQQHKYFVTRPNVMSILSAL